MVYRISLSTKASVQPGLSKPSEMAPIGKTKAAASMGISSDGSWLVVIGGDKAYVSLTSAPEPSFSKFVSPERLTCLAFHPSEPYFATGDEIGQVRLWYCLNEQASSSSVSTNERRAQTVTMHWHAHAVSFLAFTPNGAYLLSGGEESVLVIWQLHSGKREYVPRLGAPISSVSIRSPTGGEEEYLVGLSDGSSVFVHSASLAITRSVARVRLGKLEPVPSQVTYSLLPFVRCARSFATAAQRRSSGIPPFIFNVPPPRLASIFSSGVFARRIDTSTRT